MLAKLSPMAFVALSLTASAAYADFLPPNNLNLQDHRYRATTTMTEDTFNAVIDEAEAYYKPLFKNTYNATWKVNRNWNDSTVNASATQFFGTWTVNMYGGLARRPETTRDGFAMVLCHEIGHHLGGYPFTSSWAANEGEADYFAAQSCAHDLWKDQKDVNAQARDKISAYPKSLCDSAWQTEDEQNLCYRTLLAAESLGNLLGALEGSTNSWQTPDTTVVKKTDNNHPAGQCRLNTYAAAALCTQSFDAHVIPGKDLGSKRNSADAETASGKYTCVKTDFTVGLRPTCWFKSLL